MRIPRATNKNSILCKLGVHKWHKYNLGWRRYCERCLKIQLAVGSRTWQDTTFANWEGKDTYFRIDKE